MKVEVHTNLAGKVTRYGCAETPEGIFPYKKFLAGTMALTNVNKCTWAPADVVFT